MILFVTVFTLSGSSFYLYSRFSRNKLQNMIGEIKWENSDTVHVIDALKISTLNHKFDRLISPLGKDGKYDCKDFFYEQRTCKLSLQEIEVISIKQWGDEYKYLRNIITENLVQSQRAAEQRFFVRKTNKREHFIERLWLETQKIQRYSEFIQLPCSQMLANKRTCRFNLEGPDEAKYHIEFFNKLDHSNTIQAKGFLELFKHPVLQKFINEKYYTKAKVIYNTSDLSPFHVEQLKQYLLKVSREGK